MEQSELAKLLPKHRDDVEGARAILALGYPAVAPVLTSLFQWLETSGSKVELEVRPFFATLGEPAFILVQQALRTTVKPARRYSIVRFVLPSWHRDLVAKLEPELQSLLQTYDFYGVDAWALRVLLDKNVGSHEELQRWQKLKMAQRQEQLEVLAL